MKSNNVFKLACLKGGQVCGHLQISQEVVKNMMANVLIKTALLTSVNAQKNYGRLETSSKNIINMQTFQNIR